jgi:hypothetical protein
MKELVLKNWKTSLIGLIIICGMLFKAFTVGFSIQDSIFGFVSIGFIFSKDKRDKKEE